MKNLVACFPESKEAAFLDFSGAANEVTNLSTLFPLCDSLCILYIKDDTRTDCDANEKLTNKRLQCGPVQFGAELESGMARPIIVYTCT